MRAFILFFFYVCCFWHFGCWVVDKYRAFLAPRQEVFPIITKIKKYKQTYTHTHTYLYNKPTHKNKNIICMWISFQNENIAWYTWYFYDLQTKQKLKIYNLFLWSRKLNLLSTKRRRYHCNDFTFNVTCNCIWKQRSCSFQSIQDNITIILNTPLRLKQQQIFSYVVCISYQLLYSTKTMINL